MKQNGTRRLTKQQLQAAQYVAEDSLKDEQIAEKLNIGRTTLHRWKLLPEFESRVQHIRDVYADRALNHGLAKKEKRLADLDEVYGKIQTVIAERANSPDLANIPGGKTGIVAKTLKGIGKGEDYQVVEVYEVDTPLIKEIRAIHQQYAEELGQRVEKHDVAVTAKEGVDEQIAQLLNLGARRSAMKKQRVM